MGNIATFADMKETIYLEDLSIGYHLGKRDRVVARGLNASLGSGQLTCLIGSNGAGKSTLLRTLAGFQPPLAGRVLFAGKKRKDLSAFAPKDLARRIGVVLTQRTDATRLTVAEMVGLGRSPYTGFWGTLTKEDRCIVDEAISQVGIANLRNRMVGTLSDGELQKVMIAKVLAQQTAVIFLDEPTAFLDYPAKVDMLLLLRSLAREANKTIFLSTHDMELALQLADSLWLMEKGSVGEDRLETEDASQLSQIAIGSPRQLADQGCLSRFLDRKGISFDTATLHIHVC